LISVGEAPKAPGPTNIDNSVNGEDWVTWRRLSAERINKICYGYELRFSERTARIINELGEQNELPGGLCAASDKHGKNEENIKEIINNLDYAVNLLTPNPLYS